VLNQAASFYCKSLCASFGMDMDSTVIYIVILVVCLIFSAFFSFAEIAFMTLPRHRINVLLEKGIKSAKTVDKLTSRLDKLLSTILFSNTIVNVAAASIATLLATNLLGSEEIGAFVATIALIIVLLIFCETTPKTIAAVHNEKIAIAYAPILNFIQVIFTPVVWLLSGISNFIARLFGAYQKTAPAVLEEDIRSMVSESSKLGDVQEQEAEMIQNIFDFSDRPVSEVFLPRPEIVGIEKGSTLENYLQLFKETPVSRMPIFEENMDNILGFIAAKDVLLAFADGSADNDTLVERLLRPLHFTPETKKIGDLFNEMREKNYNFCVVVDEYGGTAGIITFSMLMQEIVGPLGDEHMSSDKELQPLNKDAYRIDAGMNVGELNEETGLDIPEGEGYETVAGFIMNYLGFIPTQGQVVEYNNLRLVITRMKGNRIEEIIIKREQLSKENEQKN